jgi:hypothetical protein
VITSTLNLGVSLTSAQAESLLAAANDAGNPDASLDDQLGASIPIAPVNTALLSVDVLGEALADTGVSAEDLAVILSELAQAINPADVRVGDLAGDEALANGFSDSFADMDTDISFDPATGILYFTISAPAAVQAQSATFAVQAATEADRVIPARVVSSYVVPEGFPQGIQMRADGSVVITNGQLASVAVPAPHDPLRFYADVSALGKVSMDERGNVSIVAPDFLFSASFDFNGVSYGAAQESLTYQVPGGGDESSVNYVITVTYPDGATQRLQPFVAAAGFFDSVAAIGAVVSVDRNTGIMTVNGAPFRPSYFIEPLEDSTQAFWNENKDAKGLAYRMRDLNGDGRSDYEVISTTGVQAVYGLP